MSTEQQLFPQNWGSKEDRPPLQLWDNSMGAIGMSWYTALSLPDREETFHPFCVTSLLYRKKYSRLVSDSIKNQHCTTLFKGFPLKTSQESEYYTLNRKQLQPGHN